MERLTTVDAYRLWAASWDSLASPIVELERRYLSSWLCNLQDKIFVDVGCGTGRWMLHAAQAGARTIGVGISLEMLQQAAFKPGLCGRLAIADMTKLPLANECADVVLCALTLGPSRDAAAVLAELLRVPRAGGRVVISDFHPEAIRNGWKRTFQCGSETLEVESFPYAVETLVEQARAGGYCLDQLLELSFGAEEEQIFLDAGRADLFARASNRAAVLLWCVRRL